MNNMNQMTVYLFAGVQIEHGVTGSWGSFLGGAGVSEMMANVWVSVSEQRSPKTRSWPSLPKKEVLQTAKTRSMIFLFFFDYVLFGSTFFQIVQLQKRPFFPQMDGRHLPIQWHRPRLVLHGRFRVSPRPAHAAAQHLRAEAWKATHAAARASRRDPCGKAEEGGNQDIAGGNGWFECLVNGCLLWSMDFKRWRGCFMLFLLWWLL